MKTLVIRLNGGMGNQMFQYAFAKFLANQSDALLKIDKSLFDLAYVPETYRLNEFRIQPQFTSMWQNRIHRLLLSSKIPLTLREKICHLQGIEVVSGIPENNWAQPTRLLLGYFQYPEFFASSLEELRRDFELPIVEPRAAAYLKKIEASVSVAVHIRRGDYAQIPLFRNTLGVLSAEYYHSAISLMRDMAPNARFFFFTNDPDWVVGALRDEVHAGELITLGSGSKDTTEMALMRECNHFIVGNSTFSWWPAFLSERPAKIVIAPSPWFRGQVSGETLLMPECIRCAAEWE